MGVDAGTHSAMLCMLGKGVVWGGGPRHRCWRGSTHSDMSLWAKLVWEGYGCQGEMQNVHLIQLSMTKLY